MARTKFAHIWDKDTGKWFGFMDTERNALAWVRKQSGRNFEVNTTPPARPELETTDTATAATVDAGLTAALAAVAPKAEEATHADAAPAAGEAD